MLREGQNTVVSPAGGGSTRPTATATATVAQPAAHAAFEFTQLQRTLPSNSPWPNVLKQTCQVLVKNGPAARSAAERLHTVGENIASFTPATIYTYIDPPNTAHVIERDKMGGWMIHFFTIFRNVLILVPLVLTWLGLAWAADQYHTYLAAHSKDPNAENTPFLQLWQSGFSSHNNILTFSHFAYVDLGLFLGLIVIGLIVDVRGTSARASAEQARAKLEMASRALADISLDLTGGVTATTSPVQWATQVHSVLQQATNVVSDVGSRLQAISTQMQQFQSSVGALTTSANQIGTQADALTRAVTNVQGSASSLATSAQSLDAQTARLVTAQQSTATQLTSVATSVGTAAGAMTTFQNQLSSTRTAIEAASTQLQATATAVQRISTATQNINGLATALQTTMDGLRNSQTATNQTMQGILSHAQTAANNTGRAADSISQTLTGFNVELQTTQRALGRTTQELDRTANILRGIDITIRGPLAWFFDRLFGRGRSASAVSGNQQVTGGAQAQFTGQNPNPQAPMPPPPQWPSPQP